MLKIDSLAVYELPRTIGPYRIERVLGLGGMATVMLGQVNSAPPVAVKLLHSGGQRLRQRFARECRVLAELDHIGIISVLDSGEHQGSPWYAMPFIDGPDLAQLALTLRKRAPAEREARVREVAIELCDALRHVHARGLVHRDVKPRNVLLTPSGRAVLIDFGVVADAEADPVTAAGTLVGTASWAAPEQLSGAEVDARPDQYGLGATLYFVLTGRRPIDAQEPVEILQRVLGGAIRAPSALDPSVSPALESTILRLLNAKPEDRFGDMAEVAKAFAPAGRAGQPLAGRQAALDALAAVLDTVAQGTGQLLVVAGAPRSGRGWLASIARSSAERRGVQVVLADDPLSLATARDRIAQGEPILVMTARDVLGDARIQLAPLSLADVRRSTFALAPKTENLAEVAEALHRWSGGNAGLFLELTAQLVREGAVHLDLPLVIEAGPWLDGLDLDAITVLGALAAVPTALDADSLAQIAQVPVEEPLRTLLGRGLVDGEAGAWRLVPEALRSLILARLPDADALVDRALTVLPSDETDDGDALADEAQRLRASSGLVAALKLLETAEWTSQRGLLLGRFYWQNSDVGRASETFERVLAHAPPGLLRARAAMGAGAAALHAGEVDRALDRFTQAMTEASIPGVDARGHLALAWLNLAEARGLAGESTEALRCARRGLDLARAERDRALECLATRTLGAAELDAGAFVEATATLADASALARAASMDGERFVAHTLRAELSLRVGSDRAAAAAAWERVLPLLDGGPSPDPEGWQAVAWAVAAWARLRLGDSEAAARWGRNALARQVSAPGRARVARILAGLGLSV